jgi:putative hydrolase of the HAD superfamily
MTPARPIVLTDADNTLWDTDSVFANAQLRLLSLVEALAGQSCPKQDRLAFVRRFDQALAARHHLNLKYPPQMLVVALSCGLRSNGIDRIAEDIVSGRQSQELASGEVEAAVAVYAEALRSVPELLPTVKDGLLAAKTYELPVYVVTEGSVEKQRRIVATHGLDAVILGVWELAKNVSQFQRLRRRFEPSTVVVLGDQVDRDIVPAHAAGCRTVLIPSRFRPQWHRQTDWHDADFVAETFRDGIQWIAERVRPTLGETNAIEP